MGRGVVQTWQVNEVKLEVKEDEAKVESGCAFKVFTLKVAPGI